MLLMLDNYDSFTYTLVQYFQALGEDVVVKRNDEIGLSAIKQLQPKRIVISPGPKSPAEAGLSIALIKEFYQSVPVLGVCLGHQSIAQAFGGNVIRANKVMHGKTSKINHNRQGLFRGLPEPLTVTRYHSLIVEPASLPDFIEPTAWVANSESTNAELMALALKEYPVMGVQFHPESVLTENGNNLLANFLAY